ncbi:MAG: hypothetical protein CMF49_04635 [Legionellales bacterium]|nr:hypothetical protein [Legionellales bacterium]|tara:strand:+ start:44 stop:595 length:552 start_codon:yes stop_codon:yes gene_type:complete
MTIEIFDHLKKISNKLDKSLELIEALIESLINTTITQDPMEAINPALIFSLSHLQDPRTNSLIGSLAELIAQLKSALTSSKEQIAHNISQNNPTIPEEFLSLQEMYSSKIKEINQILGQIRQTMRNEALKSSNIFGKAFLFHNDMTEQEVAALKMFKESFNELSKFLSTSQFVIDKPSSRPRL